MTLCQHYSGDWELLQLGTLDEARSQAMRAHASTCGECRRRWSDARLVLAHVGGSLPEVEPPPHVESRLLARLDDPRGATGQPPRPSARMPWRSAAIAASIALALMTIATAALVVRNREIGKDLRAAQERVAPLPAPPAVPAPDLPTPAVAIPTPVETAPATQSKPMPGDWEQERARLADALQRSDAARLTALAEAARLADELETAQLELSRQAQQRATASTPVAAADPRSAELTARIAELSSQVTRLEGQAQTQAVTIREYAAAIDVAFDSRATRVALRPIDAAAGRASAVATLTPDGRLLLLARDLPLLPADKCYQLWLVRRNDPAVISGGVIEVSRQGQAFHTLKVVDPRQVTAFALTDEPAGGSQASRGRKLLFGAVRQ